MENFLEKNEFEPGLREKLQNMDWITIQAMRDDELLEECCKLGLGLPDYMNLKKSLDDVKNAIVPSPPSTTPENMDLPECVKQMLRPNAFTDHLMFDNDTLIKIFNTAYKEIPFHQFKSYVTIQQLQWWKIQSQHNIHRDRCDRIFKSVKTDDGSELNCMKYGDETTTIISTDVHRMEKTIEYVAKQRASIKQTMSYIAGLRICLFNNKDKMHSYKQEEFNFTLRRNLHGRF